MVEKGEGGPLRIGERRKNFKLIDRSYPARSWTGRFRTCPAPGGRLFDEPETVPIQWMVKRQRPGHRLRGFSVTNWPLLMRED